jgi:hypothetical protein
MSNDEMMIYINANPDSRISDLCSKFGVSPTRAASSAYRMTKTGWLIRNHKKSALNNKMVIAYRVHPDWNQISDNPDGSMKIPNLLKVLRIQYKHGSKELTYRLVEAHNNWRRANQQPLISMMDVIQ